MDNELYRNLEYKGRQWAIKKIDAQLGSFYAYQLMEKSAPELEEKAELENMKPNRPTMSKREFLEMQKDFLSVCFEKLPSGNRPVIDKDGNYGVENIERDAPLLQILYINSFAHSLKGFFVDGHLKALAEAMTGLSPQIVQQSESGNNSSSIQ